jgi:hypothetical protein
MGGFGHHGGRARFVLMVQQAFSIAYGLMLSSMAKAQWLSLVPLTKNVCLAFFLLAGDVRHVQFVQCSSKLGCGRCQAGEFRCTEGLVRGDARLDGS